MTPLKESVGAISSINAKKLNLFCAIIAMAAFITMGALSTLAQSPASQSSSKSGAETLELTRAELLDHIYGGWVGMLVGGIEGLAHEFKYSTEPRESLPDFEYLPEGARTDDDNDFELLHIFYMDKEKTIKIPYPRIAEIWKANMNDGIWCANAQARLLMDSGIVPPETGSLMLNGYAPYNLAAQFAVESYGLISPGMPATAAGIGLHYARISVDAEPLQATQYWTSLISLAPYSKGSIEDLLKECLKAVDPDSSQFEVANDAINAFHANPKDWKAARQAIYKKWSGESSWNMNSTPVNGGMVILALLYGDGDYYLSEQYSMAMGLDADCDAATVGAVVGSRMGFKKMQSLPKFHMPDVFANKTRPDMPASMKISEQAELFTRVSEQVILSNGGEKIDIAGQPGYRIRLQTPRSQVSVPDWATNKCIFPLAKIRTKGTVVKVDGDNITVKINGGSEQVIPTGGAKVTQGGKPSTLAELKPGTAVKVTFKGCNYPFQAEKSPAIEISAM